MNIFKRIRRPQRVCPKTGKPIARKFLYPWLKWLFPLTGVGALIWFLIRVIPKPSRATYPCQRIAFPVASSFITYILGLSAAAIAMKKAKQRMHQARYVLAAVCVIVAIACAWLTVSIHSRYVNAAYAPVDPPNSPIGIAKGIFPGRVAWIHDANSTYWDSAWNNRTDIFWWDDAHTNQTVVDQMYSKALRAMTNEPTDAAAWDATFRYFNQTRGRGDTGYTPGQKIAIKPNHVEHRRHNYTVQNADLAPQMVVALLKQLVWQAGVPEDCITICDSSRYIANKTFDRCYALFPNVHYLETNFYVSGVDDRNTDPRRPTVAMSSQPSIHYSAISPALGTTIPPDNIPVPFVEADYVINLAVMKGHTGGGVTLSAKNWYGSFGREPGSQEPFYYNAHHYTLAMDTPAYAKYRVLVDLMGHKDLGGKTMLCIFDGLWGFPKHGSGSRPTKWLNTPFNNDYPSSILMSQDQVAIDSVGLDFLRAEFSSNMGTVHIDGAIDDYMHEAALADDPPSGTFYDPDHPIGDPCAVRLSSLGVHEHWNNAADQQYSRNLGTGSGIELVTSATLSCSGDIAGDVNTDCEVNYEDLQIIAENWLTAQIDERDGDLYDDDVIDFRDFAVMAADWAECNIEPAGNCNAP